MTNVFLSWDANCCAEIQVVLEGLDEDVYRVMREQVPACKEGGGGGG